MGFLWFILIGLVAGLLAGTVMKCTGCGITGDIIAGVIGAVLGGFVFRFFGTDMDWGVFG